nr:TniQ family protein [Kordiimonas marina]
MIAPQAAESVLGYMVRLTEANYYPNTDWTYKLFGINNACFGWSQTYRVSKQISDLLGSKEYVFRRSACMPRGSGNHRKLSLDGVHEFDVMDMRAKAPNICPKCLAEFGYLFAAWEFISLKVCPRHRCYLLDRCQQCLSSFSWRRANVSRCQNCDFDFRLSEVCQAPSSSVAFAQLLARKLPIPFSLPSPSNGNVWEAVPLNIFLSNVRLLTDFIPSIDQGFRLRQFSWRSAVEAVAYCFIDWPHGFIEYLSKFPRESAFRDQPGDKLCYSLGIDRLYKRIVTEDKKGDHELLKGPLSDFAMSDPLRSLITGRGNGALYNADLRRKWYLTKEEVKRELHVSSKRFHELMIDRELKGFRLRLHGQSHYRVTALSVKKYKNEIANSWLLPDAMKHLGISKGLLVQLINGGYLYRRRSLVEMGGYAYCVSQSEAQQLFEMPAAAFKPAFFGNNTGCALAGAYKVARTRQHLKPSDAIDALVSGRIPPRFIAEAVKTLNRFYYCCWDIMRAAGQEWLSQVSAMRALDLKRRQLEVLCDTNDETAIRSKLDGQAPIYNLADIIAFAETYVKKSVLTKRLSARDGGDNLEVDISDLKISIDLGRGDGFLKLRDLSPATIRAISRISDAM